MPDSLSDPLAEYERRLANRREVIVRDERLDDRISRWRLIVFIAGVVTAIFTIGNDGRSDWWAVLPFSVYIGLIVFHEQVVRQHVPPGQQCRGGDGRLAGAGVAEDQQRLLAAADQGSVEDDLVSSLEPPRQGAEQQLAARAPVGRRDRPRIELNVVVRDRGTRTRLVTQQERVPVVPAQQRSVLKRGW